MGLDDVAHAGAEEGAKRGWLLTHEKGDLRSARIRPQSLASGPEQVRIDEHKKAIALSRPR
jgi:hypothetical protein